MKTIYTAIFGNYENLKEPEIITPGWKYICFTDQDLKSNTWEIKKAPLIDTPQRTARYYKIMFHKHIDTDCSIWVDASFTITTDLNKWWVDKYRNLFSCATHPLRTDVFKEAEACINNKRGNEYEISSHIKKYVGQVPPNNGLITSGILLRRIAHPSIKLCEDWWEEVKNNSTRDQIAFAKASIRHENIIHTYYWNYMDNNEFKFKTHYHRR